MNLRERAELGMLKHANHRETIKHLEAKNAKLRARIAELESGAAPGRSGESGGEQCSVCREVGKNCPFECDPRTTAPEAASSSAAPSDVELTVWYGSMPESNGKSNFTATLTRNGATGLDKFDGYTFARSEYPERVRYEADCMRHLIGELEKKPFILDYDADKHSGYVKPSPTGESLDIEQCFALAKKKQATRESLSDEQVQTWINGIGSGVWANGKLSLTQVELASVIRGIAALATPRQPEDGSGLSAALNQMRAAFHVNMLRAFPDKSHAEISAEIDRACDLAPKEPADQGGVPEAEPVAWIRKTDITELTDSEPETNGWTALYAAPTGASK